ncbi:YkgJ family cysteine cluster protein [soil metagenome]
MREINFRKFRNQFKAKKKQLRNFITRAEKRPAQLLAVIAEEKDKEVWSEINCLSCANCCKKMSPTYTWQDIKRIAAHLQMRPKDFKEKFLYLDKRDNDWMNVKRPCQFLDLGTNMCTIYEVRPADCAGFPHLTRKPIPDYMHVHKQNIEYCPATMLFTEKLKAALDRTLIATTL